MYPGMNLGILSGHRCTFTQVGKELGVRRGVRTMKSRIRVNVIRNSREMVALHDRVPAMLL